VVRDVRSLFSSEVLSQVRKGTGSPMTTTAPPIVKCPVCGSQGSMLHHDIRASLVYSCANCLHEWQIDPAEEPPKPEFRQPEDPGTSTATKRRRPRKS
jgi:hypothetical protein